MSKRKATRQFYNRVRDFRKRAGLTQDSVARQIDMKWLTISETERGLHNPHLMTKKKLAKLFGVSVECLFPVDEQGRPLLREDVEKKEEANIAA